MNQFKIMGRYKNQTEEIETEIESMQDAEYMLTEYQIAFGSDWTLWIEDDI